MMPAHTPHHGALGSTTRRVAWIAFLLVWSVADAAAQDVAVRTETRRAGPYTLEIAIHTVPFVERAVPVTVTILAGMTAGQAVVVRAVGMPAPDTFATRTEIVALAQEAQDPRRYRGEIRFPVQGRWGLVVRIVSPSGDATAQVPLTVAAPYAIPEWVGWIVGLSPLLGVLRFAWTQRRYLQQRRREGPSDRWLIPPSSPA